MSAGPEQPTLTPFQLEVSLLFFTLPSARGFLLAGGAALLAQRLTTRPTQDLDFFSRHGDDVATVRDELEVAAATRDWTVTRVHDGATFCRLRRFTDAEIPIAAEEVPVMRDFFASWAEQLRDKPTE